MEAGEAGMPASRGVCICKQQTLSLVGVQLMRGTMMKSLNVSTAFQHSLDLCNKFLFLD